MWRSETEPVMPADEEPLLCREIRYSTRTVKEFQSGAGEVMIR
jgi:hypothetical protein